MNKLMSMVCLKYIYDEKQDFIGALSEFILTIIAEDRSIEITPSILCERFEREYGFSIPHVPMQEILSTIAKKGYIYELRGDYRATEKINDVPIRSSRKLNEIERKYNSLIHDLIDFSEEHFKRSFSFDEAEKLLLLFFEENIHLLIESNGYEFTGIDVDDELKIVALFIEYIEGNDKKTYDSILEIAVGNLIINTLFLKNFINANATNYYFHCYIDTPILFEITGINGDIRKKAYISFLNLLKDRGIQLMVFEHNYEEFITSLENSIIWINNSNYDPAKASRATRFFKENNYNTEHDILQFIIQAKDLFNSMNISRRLCPSPNQNERYQIDSDHLLRLIKEKYITDKTNYNPLEIENTILRDIKSIEAIYKLRKSKKPTSLREVEHVMVTTNSTLVNVCREFQKMTGDSGNMISVFVSDLELGTLVWLTSMPQLVESFARAKMISKALSIIEPSPDLFNALEKRVRSERNKGNITEEQTVLLLETQQSRILLTQYTLGNKDRVTEKTPYEILMRINNEKDSEINQLKQEKDIQVGKNLELSSVLRTISFILAIIGCLIIVLPIALILIINLLTKIELIEISGKLFNLIIDFTDGLVALISTISGVTLISLGFFLFELFYKTISRRLKIVYKPTKLAEVWQRIIKK
jgi:hypothetical protein